MSVKHRDRLELTRDLKNGFAAGILVAGICAAFAALSFVVGGATAFHERTHLGFGVALLLYLFGGATGGAIIGLLLPLRRSTWGAFVQGLIAAIPFACAVMMTGLSRSDWYPLVPIGVAIISLGLGGLSAALYGEDHPG